METVSLLQRPIDCYYSRPNPLSRLNLFWTVLCYEAGFGVNDISDVEDTQIEPSTIALVCCFISQQLVCIDPRGYTAIFHLLLRYEACY
jgi:hypothetical protein